jgi:hypothetical protein
MQYDTSELEDQQELDEFKEYGMDVVTEKTPPVENQIIGYISFDCIRSSSSSMGSFRIISLIVSCIE